MNNDVLLIVLTEDRWLYAGLAALMPEMVCRLSGFLAHRQPRVVRVARHIIIVVDSRILFRAGVVRHSGAAGRMPASPPRD